ncbi:hypothetical protein SAMN05421636_105101 [Pricia antarctica]|uniref:Nitrogen regulatory protein P-II family n=1 Tax=Pricia antarctica TaxID=641691 RepID=A0A1G7D124_9FLAO|nr:hypothetical protein [Pricia antarctica]SDE44730.1 hypothetical protein SAMN05421636_105101 [Pricia antarctica]
MKLLIVTVVEQFEKEILRLFKQANIESFSGSDIDGYKNHTSMVRTASWFPSEKGRVESSLFFSFTEDGNIEILFELIKEFNSTLETNNPIKAVVVPIEKSI